MLRAYFQDWPSSLDWVAAVLAAAVLSPGAAWATPWGVLATAQVLGTTSQTSVVGTGNYSAVDAFDGRTAVSTSAAADLGRAAAYADLATGRAGVFSNNIETPQTVEQGNSSVAWDDLVTFAAPGFLGGLSVPVSLGVDGSLGMPSNAEVYLEIGYTGTDGQTHSSGFSEYADFRGVMAFDATGNWSSQGLSATGSFTLDPTQPISILFGMDCQYECDLYHTATFSWRLPDGVTFTSASGVFLTEGAGTPAPMPEPGSLGLVLMGAGVLAAGRGRPRGSLPPRARQMFGT